MVDDAPAGVEYAQHISRALREALSSESQTDIERIEEFYRSWTPAGVNEGGMHSGGWIAGNLSNPQVRQHFYVTLLYHSSALMHDPLADYFDRHVSHLEDPPLRSEHE